MRLCAFAVALSALTSSLPAFGQPAPLPVALSGTASPAGGTYANFYTSPAIDAAGRVAFATTLTGGPAPSALFVGPAGGLQTAAATGAPAPGGGLYESAGQPILDSSGRLAFATSGSSGISGLALYAGPAAALQAVARGTETAPGGGNYSAVLEPIAYNGGQAAFGANVSGTASGVGLFAGAAGAVQAVARAGGPAPTGGTYSGSFNAQSVNASGQVAFLAGVSGGPSPAAIFAGAAGSVQSVARLGQPTPAGGVYAGFQSPAINNAGQVAFTAGVGGSPANSGVFAGTASAVQAVAAAGAPTPAGGFYTGFGQPALINAAGQVAFVAGVAGLPPGSQGVPVQSGVFAGAAGAVRTVALQGDAAPGGGVLTFNGLFPIVINGVGEVAFRTTLTGAGVTAASDVGLYARSNTLGLVKVVREGDVIDVDPSAGISLKTVADNGIALAGFSGGEDGRPVALNDAGVITYRLTFTDGSAGIFISQIAPVPEPLGVLAAAGLGLGGRAAWRRRAVTSPSPCGSRE